VVLVIALLKLQVKEVMVELLHKGQMFVEVVAEVPVLLVLMALLQ
jgi:hypothetical protein